MKTPVKREFSETESYSNDPPCIIGRPLFSELPQKEANFTDIYELKVFKKRIHHGTGVLITRYYQIRVKSTHEVIATGDSLTELRENLQYNQRMDDRFYSCAKHEASGFAKDGAGCIA